MSSIKSPVGRAPSEPVSLAELEAAELKCRQLMTTLTRAFEVMTEDQRNLSAKLEAMIKSLDAIPHEIEAQDIIATTTTEPAV